MHPSSPLPGSRSWSARRHLGLGFGLLCAAVVLAAGCAKKDKDSVSGKVTLGGQPVAGIVTFAYDKSEISAPTTADGSYIFTAPPPGQVKVTVKPLPGAGAGALAPPPKGGPDMPSMPAGTASGQGVPPPAKYGSPATSDLSYEVKAGKQTYNIDLKP